MEDVWTARSAWLGTPPASAQHPQNPHRATEVQARNLWSPSYCCPDGLETNIADAYEDQDTLLATVSNPRCKLIWTGDQTLREKCRSLLTAEAALINTPVQPPTKCTAEQPDFIIYEEVTGTPETATFLMSGLSQNVNELDK
ncbi:uncharacterized protein LOC112567575 [Pomacea canaliculata]|uniref:uncharacterized protein LOC112567575 n=1 Tax=Pomacea canaliculata TaxID=400727 RepID=UPI000D73E8F5|nr:uncharacterized protein LOC112567575 [Pomacea canaliculata]